jgi:hypothetical protein
MGSTHFLTRTLEKVKTEMSLQVLAYNINRLFMNRASGSVQNLSHFGSVACSG